ncbi:MAG: S-methyl-5'-thioadenosine phosphorylase [Acidobacteriia bacterium]|nr:S-methyl-5'-thioadenosine phosphorylase [Terriglobia bacterium]
MPVHRPKSKSRSHVERANAVEVGVIGGSGLYEMAELAEKNEVAVSTPFGKPSDPLVIGTLRGRRVAFLARHGRGHRLMPTEINYRANIYAMKKLGVERIISASAVGSLKEEHQPLDILLPDQFFDRTRYREGETFFGKGLVAHISFADPVCPQLCDLLETSARVESIPIHRGGTYLCMEGPAFSTKAESNVYRSLGMDVIGMTNLQEAKLAREAEICYATLALVTDYDCWHPEHDAVTVAQIIDNLNRNAVNAQKVIAAAVADMPAQRICKCGSALSHALLTERSRILPATRRKLDLLVKKYL